MGTKTARKQKNCLLGNPAGTPKRPQLLLYGFGPYDHFAGNITARAIKKLAPRAGLKKLIFPVHFNESQFVRAIRKHTPVAVLGLGQCSRGRRFRIERRAVNRKRRRLAKNSGPIHVGGRRWLKTTLHLKSSREARRSQDAGTYVCNFSMYVMLQYLRRNRLPAQFGFIHVPFDFEINRVTAYLEKIIARLEPALRSSPARRKY